MGPRVLGNSRPIDPRTLGILGPAWETFPRILTIKSLNISNRSSHEVQFDGCSWQMCAAANVQLCWLVAHCKWYNLGCLDGWLHTPLQIWYNPTVAEQCKGSGTVSVFSSSRFPSLLFLQLVAIITIFSLLILLTFNFHVVSVSYIVTFKKCLSDDKHLCL